MIASYIHPGSRLGVLLEVNCETDFVAASEKFNQLVNGLAMQIAASPTVSVCACACVRVCEHVCVCVCVCAHM